MPVALVNGASINYLQVEPDAANVQAGVPENLVPENLVPENLVMVHGLATNLAFWYLPYAQAFAKRFRVTVFDLRGHGRSQLTPNGYTPESLATDLRALLDHLDIERAHFVAHSFGGVVTLRFADLDPERVSSLVLADTQLSVTRHTHGETWAHGEVIQELVDRYGLDLDTRAPFFGYDLITEVAELLLREGDIPAELFELVGPTLGKDRRRTAKRWLELIRQGRDELMADDGLSVETLQSFRFPTLALYGDRSKARATSQLLQTLWSHADFHTLRNAGHFFPSSRATEVIAACEWFWDTRLRPTLDMPAQPFLDPSSSVPFDWFDQPIAPPVPSLSAMQAEAVSG